VKRVLAAIVTLLGCSALAVFATGASNSKSHNYWVEFDDAFGLIQGGDVKIAGVRAGKIGELKIDRKTNRALVEIKVTKSGFGSIRTDVTCQARPQSLIGEYFVDCQPGVAPKVLDEGATIPVSRTSSVVAPDLVNNVLRRPFRERFSIIVNELGAAVAGNAQNLNDAIKRASPGLQETDKVLHILAGQNHILAELVRNGDKVIGDLARNRSDVARWVVMADRASSASAQRRDDIARGFHLLPGFLEQLQPAMVQLGRVADEQTPALRTLSEAAPQLKTFFDQLAPFADVSKPAFEALGKASDTGRDAVKAAGPTVDLLKSFSKGAPELAGNLNVILKHLDNRKYSAELNPRSPGGKGYTGLESLLEYVYDQVLSVNIYDSSVHILKVTPFAGDCAAYADVNAALAKDPDGKPLSNRCGAGLGPHAAGVNFPDATRPANLPPYGELTAAQQNPFSASKQRASKSFADSIFGVLKTAAAAQGKPQPQAAAAPKTNPDVPTLSDVIPGAPNVVIPTPPKAIEDIAKAQQAQKTQTKLLDYLLGS
jgi:virulence factor Mce-like protein